MKWIINKYVFFIIFGIAISLITSLVIRETTLKRLNTKYHEYLTKKDAFVVYSFAEGKQQMLLEVSTTILGEEILAPQRYPDYSIEKQEFLCPSLNNNVKNLILKNFDKLEDKQDFIIAYGELVDFCEK